MPPRRRKEWFDDDAFWQDVYPFLFPEARFADAAEQVRQVVALANPAGLSALDLCCGPGRHALALSAAGFTVTGVDRTKHFLNKARMRARQAGLTVEWVQADMRDFVRPGAFDLVLSMFTSFGYFRDKDEDARVLENVLTSLAPGGVCLIDVMGKERLAEIFQATSSDVLANGNVLVQHHEIIDDWTRVRNDWVVIRKGRAKHFSFDHTVYSGEELRALLDRAGFADISLYGNLAGAPYGRGAERLVAVARRPPEGA